MSQETKSIGGRKEEKGGKMVGSSTRETDSKKLEKKGGSLACRNSKGNQASTEKRGNEKEKQDSKRDVKDGTSHALGHHKKGAKRKRLYTGDSTLFTKRKRHRGKKEKRKKGKERGGRKKLYYSSGREGRERTRLMAN